MLMKKIWILLLLLFIPVVKAEELPKVYLNGDLTFMSSKEDKREIEIEFVSDEYNFKEKGTIKLQGSSSLDYDKKNYNITFEEKQETSLGSFKKYTLKANWIDELHIRNLLTASIVRDINKEYKLFSDTINYGVTDGFYVEVYNNGEYMGLYSMNISKKYLFDTSEKEALVIGVKNNVDQSYFLKEENIKWDGFEVEEGEADQDSLDKLNRLINFINKSSDREFKKNFEKYINLDSALNYYCIMNVLLMTDNAINNVYLVSYDGDYWYISFYDMDISWGGTNKQNKLFDYTRDLNKEIRESRLWDRFEVAYSKEIKERYKELRKKYLSKDYLLDRYYEYLDKIPEEALKRENEKWNNEVQYDKHYIDDFMDNRLKMLDKKIDHLGYSSRLIIISIYVFVLLMLGWVLLNVKKG